MSSSGLDTTGFKIRKPKLGIIGGSGMCSFREFKVVSETRPETKYGLPSDTISICELGNELMAFIPRHGSRHTIAPHKVPYKANLAALKNLGVEYVIGTCIVGSLKKEVVPGSIVLPDQFVNLTWGRDDFSEADGGSFIHLPMGEPYCRHLREKIIGIAGEISLPVISQATVAVIQGPRFSTVAESRWLSANGWDIVNMTQYPECCLARELGLCYSAITAVTDYDVGLQESLVIDPRHMDAVLEIFKGNIQKIKSLLLAFISKSVPELSCGCASAVLKSYYDELL
ncbi:MAG: MTAP family purine nucleoside phosphorylase [Patescibacteria group bacterium]|nr:MTAP family purine nucleoside phosphorylase [Patescibacteria group bacterium]MDE2218486.1 MTAP family purine nucleoside phosphorylase [Patescibacteria group bacterium]